MSLLRENHWAVGDIEEGTLPSAAARRNADAADMARLTTCDHDPIGRKRSFFSPFFLYLEANEVEGLDARGESVSTVE